MRQHGVVVFWGILEISIVFHTKMCELVGRSKFDHTGVQTALNIFTLFDFFLMVDRVFCMRSVIYLISYFLRLNISISLVCDYDEFSVTA